jgi:hypothetical protein
MTKSGSHGVALLTEVSFEGRRLHCDDSLSRWVLCEM